MDIKTAAPIPSTMMGGNQSLSGVFPGAQIFADRVYNNIRKLIEDIGKGELKVPSGFAQPLYLHCIIVIN